MARRLAVVLLVTAALAACDSPEATRERAGGAGGDVGNRGPVELHGRSQPYYKTPSALPPVAAGRGGEAAASPRGR